MLTILISFVSVPLTVHYLGPERYGIWLTMSSLLTWMAMTDFGLAGNALVNVISEADGMDDRKLAREYTASAFWALSTLSIVIGVLMLMAFSFIPWRSVFHVSAAVPLKELRLTCALTLCIFVSTLPLNMLNSIYNAYQDGFVANVWAIASNGLALVSLIVVTQFQGGLPELVLALSGTRMLVAAASGIYLFLFRYSWLTPRLSAVHWDRITRLLNLGGKYMITQLSSLGIYQSQPFIITQLLGPSQVTIFVIAQKIITLPVDLAYIATAPFVSACGEAKARGDWTWIRSAFKNATFALVAVGLPLAAAIALAAKLLIRLLAGQQAVPDWSVVLWLSTYSVVSIGLMMAGQLLCGVEQVGTFAISLTLCAVGTIGLGFLFVEEWGLSGIAAGMALAKLVAFLPIQGYLIRQVLRNSNSVKIAEPVTG
jgi:O-antigen/teichoic acid export membrane protein